MGSHPSGNSDYRDEYSVVAGLPLITLEVDTPIKMGGILFWQGSDYELFISKQEHKAFTKFMKAAGSFGVPNPAYRAWLRKHPRPQRKVKQWLLTQYFSPEKMTFLSIKNTLKSTLTSDQLNLYIFDAVYLLYYAAHINDFRGRMTVALNPYRYIANAEIDFIKTKDWRRQFNYEHQIDSPARVRNTATSKDLLKALSSVIDAKYK